MLRLLDLRRIDDALPVFVRPACGAYVDLRLFSHLRRRLAQPHERFAHGPNPLIQPEDCGTWPCITRGCDIPHRTPRAAAVFLLRKLSSFCREAEMIDLKEVLARKVTTEITLAPLLQFARVRRGAL